MKHKISVTSASQVEGSTKRELANLGYDAKAINGTFTFEGTLSDVAKLNISLRTGDRVYLHLGEFDALTFDELFEGLCSLPFEDYLDKNAKIIIRAKSVKSTLFATSSVSSIAKKAIISRLQQKLKTSTFQEDGAEYKIDIGILKDHVTVLLDTSGEPLHKRGYRTLAYTAPLKETLAAALIDMTVWNKEKTLIDPFSGSGTIPLEGALKALNIMPGISRNFALEEHSYFDNKIMSLAREKAKDEEKRDTPLSILGFDIDENAVSIARYHAKLLGVEDKIHFQVQDMHELSSKSRFGVIITNPPYGERLMGYKDIVKLYRDFANVYRDLPDFSAYVLTAFPEFQRIINLPISKERKIYNGSLECRFYSIMGKKPPSPRSL